MERSWWSITLHYIWSAVQGQWDRSIWIIVFATRPWSLRKAYLSNSNECPLVPLWCSCDFGAVHKCHNLLTSLCDIQQLTYPRGKGLGGSASINYLAFIRGSRYDYDEWAELGCSGWSYCDVLPYMMKCEDNSNTEYANNGN